MAIINHRNTFTNLIMKKIILFLAIALSSYCAFSQNTPWPTSGPIGIGTTSPAAHLDIVSFGDVASKVLAQNSSASQRSVGSYIYSSGTGSSVFPSTIKPSNLAANEIGFVLTNYNFVEPGQSLFRVTIAGTDNANGGPFTSGVYKDAFVIQNTGNIGIGNVSPVDKLVVTGAIRSNVGGTQGYGSFGGGFVAYDQDNGGNHLFSLTRQSNNLSVSSFDGIGFCANTNSPSNNYQLFINRDGNVLIAKTSQTNTAYKLDINGNARANAIVVNTTGADFVFDRKYSLPNLSDVKGYIEMNHHLPQIPSAEEMKKNGMDVGDLNTKLLQKVEELTLYLIEKDKQVKKQEARIAALEKALLRLNSK